MNSKYLLAICGLAIGATTAISATPASAVVINSGTLAFTDGARLEAGSIATAGGNFTANFNRGGVAVVTNADGGFSSLIPGVVDPSPAQSRAVTPSTGVNFSYTAVVPAATGGTFTATLLSALSYDFGNTIGAVNIAPGATFTGLYIAPNAVTGTGRSFFNFNSGVATFLSGTATTGGAQSTPLTLTSFNFDVDNAVTGNSSPNGAYSLVASAAVPEPFTIIGTIVGGTAALRIRKKLLAASK
jgi:hypothetical protein